MKTACGAAESRGSSVFGCGNSFQDVNAVGACGAYIAERKS
jgi:hypothetical protein